MAEEFKSQLADNAPGVMGDLAAAAGLGEGADAQKKLAKMMEKGEIGIDILLKFIEIVKKKAIDTGAYSARINSIQASESRMNDAFTYFSDSLVVQLDESIKSSFSGVTNLLEKMTAYFDEQNKIQKETGEVGTFKLIVDYLWQIFKDFGSTLMLAIEGLGEIISIIPGLGDTKAKMKGYMATRQLEAGYFEKMGAKTEKDKWRIRLNGMEGFDNYAREQFKLAAPNGTDAEYLKFREILSGGISQGGPGNVLNQMNGPNIMASAVAALLPGIKDLATKLGETKVVNEPSLLNPTFNIYGATDPIATGKVVQNELNQLLIYPR